MLHLRAANDAERRARGEVLGGLIDGRSAPDLVAGRLGLDADAPAAVLGLQLERSVINDAAQTNAVTDLVALQCCAVQPQSAVHLQLGVIYALIPAEAMPRARLRHLATTIIDRAGVALRTELTAAVGATVSSLHKIKQSRADVDVVLRLVEPGAAATVEELLPQVILLDLQAQLAAAPRRRLPIVDEMIAHDREQGTHYVDTVLAYLEFNADIASAAASLNLHHNTFRYRLHRAKELFELDLQDPDVRLVTWLQLRSRS
jgi:sugar diacid utilization regulator